MKDIIIGDIHLDMKHGDKNFLIYQDKFFTQIYDYLENNKVRYVIFLGDIFTDKQKINIDVMNYSLELFEKISSYDVEIIMINGNHVLFHKNNYNLDSTNVIFRDRKSINMELFKDYIIHDNYIFFNWKHTAKEYYDIFTDIEDYEKIEYIFGHFEMYGFMHSKFAENKNKDSLNKNDIKKYFPNIKKVISGHYHMPQKEDVIFYPGVPYELSWSEAGLDLGFHVLENGKLSFHRNNNTLFETIIIDSEEDVKKYKIEECDYGKYFKIIYNNVELESSVLKLKKKLDMLGNNVTIINNFELSGNVDIDDVDIELKESKISTNNVELNLESIIVDYIRKMNIDEEEQDIFISAFMDVYADTKIDMLQNFEL